MKKTHEWVKGKDYIILTIYPNKKAEIHHKIKGILGWHLYDFEILAFLIRELYN